MKENYKQSKLILLKQNNTIKSFSENESRLFPTLNIIRCLLFDKHFPFAYDIPHLCCRYRNMLMGQLQEEFQLLHDLHSQICSRPEISKTVLRHNGIYI